MFIGDKMAPVWFVLHLLPSRPQQLTAHMPCETHFTSVISFRDDKNPILGLPWWRSG